MTPGEVAAAGYTGYLTEKALTGMYAKSVEGAVIVVERMDRPPFLLRLLRAEILTPRHRSLLGKLEPIR